MRIYARDSRLRSSLQPSRLGRVQQLPLPPPSRAHHCRTPGLGLDPGWTAQRVDVMRRVLRLEREANAAETDALLAASADHPIVEVSTRYPWWDAPPGAARETAQWRLRHHRETLTATCGQARGVRVQRPARARPGGPEGVRRSHFSPHGGCP